MVVPESLGPQDHRPAARLGECSYARGRREHHDRLLIVEQDVNEVMELLELAVTWTELDYSESLVIPPEQWLTFAAAHTWGNPDRVLRLFSVATDIALSRAPRPSPSRALRSATTD